VRKQLKQFNPNKKQPQQSSFNKKGAGNQFSTRQSDNQSQNDPSGLNFMDITQND
jgi:hypothetical protein